MHLIKVCFGGSCQRNFAQATLTKAEEILEIRAGEITPDGAFQLEKCGCLSQCEQAPNVLFMPNASPLSAVMLDGKVETHMFPNRLETKLLELKKSSNHP